VRAFASTGDGGIGAELEPSEAALISQLAGQVADLLAPSEFVSTDPAMIRLLPDAYADDPEAADEFRRFTADELSERKVRNAATVMSDLVDVATAEGPIEILLDPESVQAWVRSLTDIRLVLAVRLGITNDSDAGWDEESENEELLVLGEVYDWLGWVQDSLVTALEA